MINMTDGIKLSDYELKNVLSGVGYLGQREKALAEAALQILKRRSSSMEQREVETMLKHLEEARLLTASDASRIVAELFKEES
jgi:hypothetical protein